MKFGFLLISLLSLGAVACGGADDGDVGEVDEEMRTAGITRIVVGSTPGFRPPPPMGDCYVSGHWFVDFAESKLQGNACIDGNNKQLDRDLTRSELSKIRSKVSALRVVRAPTSCPTDMPINSITIEKGDASTHYVDQRAACGGDKAVKEAGLGKLVDLLVELSKEEEAEGQMCGGIAGFRCPSGYHCTMSGPRHPDQSGVCKPD